MSTRRRVSWDAGDLFLISASLDHLEKHPETRRRYKNAANIPVMALGAPGGWELFPSLTFYGAIASLIVIGILGRGFFEFLLLPIILIIAVASLAYGTPRAAKQSLIRLQVLKILRSSGDQWRRFVVEPAIAHLDTLANYENKPGRLIRYLSRVKSLNRANELFEIYSRFLNALTVASGIGLLFFREEVIALFFLASVILWMAIIPISIAVSILAETVRSEVPQVLNSEDLQAVVRRESAEDAPEDSSYG